MLFRTHFGVMLFLFVILKVVFQIVWRSIEPCEIYTHPHRLKKKRLLLENMVPASFFFFLLLPFKKAAFGVCVLKLFCKESGIKVAPFDMHKRIPECSGIVTVITEM